MSRRNTLIFKRLLLVGIGFGCVAAEADRDWDSGGADTAWETAANWDADTLPTDADNITIDNGGTAVFSTASGSVDVKRGFLGEGSSSASGILNVTGGSLRFAQATQYASRIGRKGTGTVNVSGGYFGVGNQLQLGDAGTGTVNLTGGDMQVYRGGTASGIDNVSLYLLQGSLSLFGGSFETRAGVLVGANGVFSVQGGSMSFIKIGSYSTLDGFWKQESGGILNLGVNQNGVTPIYIEDVDDDGGSYAAFEAGSVLDVDYVGAGNGSGTWIVMEVENGAITNNGLAFAAGVDTSVWSFNIDNSGANGLLTITAVGDDPVAIAQINWDGSESSNWDNPLNWDAVMLPEVGSKIYFDSGTADYTSGTSPNYNALRMNAGTLNISGGTFTATKSSGLDSWVGATSGGTASVNQTGGAVKINELELGNSGGATGIYTLSDGALNIARGLNGFSLYLGGNHDGTSAGAGILSISGGSLTTRTGLKLGDAAAGGTGTWYVLGSEASEIGIGSSGDGDGWWEQGAGSTLYVAPDLRGLTKITIADDDNDGGTYVTFESGSLLDVGYYNGGYGGGTWTVMEVENGDIADNGLAFAPGVDTEVWSFKIDNSGANGILTVTAAGELAPLPIDVTLTVGDARNQMMRYGIDYERLWFWYGSGLADVPQWSVNDCNVDFVRIAMNSGYELEEGTYDLSAYTKKIIPMMTAMKAANPHIKWFASPRPLNEAVSGASWQPYPLWVTGATTYTSGDYDFNATKCAEYMIRYLLLMKSYGFKISYMDLTNEWQSNYASSGGRFGPDDAVTIKQVFDDYLVNPWPHPALDAGLLLEAEDFPLMIGASSWNYAQGEDWISKFTSTARRNAIDIASSHNTDKTGTAQDFADAAKAALGNDAEVWETEQHGWKGNSSTSEAMSFSYMIETVRAGFTGLSGWLAIGTTSQGHSYLLNNGTTVTRNVKYYMFKKLSNTSNYGYALDIDETDDLTSTMALIRENMLTVWVINTSSDSVITEIDLGSHVWDGSEIKSTRWDEDLSIDGDETPEGIEGVPLRTAAGAFIAEVKGRAAYCFEIPLMDDEDNFPFVQAESYGSGSGVSILPCNDAGGGDMVAFSEAGSEISFDLDITKTYPHDVAFRVSSESANISFEIYNGTMLVGSVNRMATGGAQNWTTLYTTLMLDGGPMDLRIVATGGDWNINWIQFDQEFYPIGSDLENIALNQPASASNVHSSGYEADKAVDGDMSTRWATSVATPWLEVDFGVPTVVAGTKISEYKSARITGYEILYFDGAWHTAFVGGSIVDGEVYSFPSVLGTKFRLQVTSSISSPTIWEFELFGGAGDPVAAMDVDPGSISLSWSGEPGATYALQRSVNLTEGFTTIESGIPVHEATNTSTMATQDDAAFYRVIVE
ncbi:carbohydrate-binding protein [Pontiellaceae bacterium B12219]|nr:carbohydrate-binding protein [Pontiellaceae bacterium B12219]